MQRASWPGGYAQARHFAPFAMVVRATWPKFCLRQTPWQVSPFCAAPTTKRTGACFYHEKIPLLASLRAAIASATLRLIPGALWRLYGLRWVLRISATKSMGEEEV
jgi:hypothetical protein